jgi:dihydrofolate synthase/folylpolyglutamate synthase
MRSMKSPAAPPDANPDIEVKLQQILQHLYTLHRTEIDLSLERLPRLLQQLGNPHLTLPPVIHVAGTNGKGSTCAMLRALLEGDGARVHVATSPHLVRPHERIRLAGQLISSAELLQVLEETLAATEGQPITFFEAFMATTFLAFLRVPADFCILETGMGGRLDATNVVPNPVCTVITTISMDHREFLGGTIAQIAGEKAGIMKPGVPCVIGYQTAEGLSGGVMDVFHRQSTALSPAAPLFRGGSEWRVEPEPDRFRFIYDSHESILNHPNLQGLHQINNAGAALAAYRIIRDGAVGAGETNKKLSTSLQQIDWPGRLQALPATHPLYAWATPGAEIVIDGGHNDSAGQVLATQARTWKSGDNRPLHIIVAMMARKNPVEFLSPLIPCADSLTAVGMKEPGALTGEELFDRLKPLGLPMVFQYPDVTEALRQMGGRTANTGHPPRILITGSLYFLGEILAMATSKPKE